LWKVGNVKGPRDADFVFDLWSQFVEGFITGQTLAEDWGNATEWARFAFPFAVKYLKLTLRKGSEQSALPILLYCLSQHPDAKLVLGDNTTVVELAGRRFGVENGTLLASHVTGFQLDVDTSWLLQPLGLTRRIENMASLKVWSELNSLRQAQQRVQGLLYFGFVLLQAGNEKNALPYFDELNSLKAFRRPKRKKLPTPEAVERALFRVKEKPESIFPELMVLTKRGFNSREFKKLFGVNGFPPARSLYKIYFRYVNYYKENSAC